MPSGRLSSHAALDEIGRVQGAMAVDPCGLGVLATFLEHRLVRDGRRGL
jgi:hypothetical protein